MAREESQRLLRTNTLDTKNCVQMIKKLLTRSIITSDNAGIERNNLVSEERIRYKPLPLNTYRLKPCSERVGNTRFLITESGTVRLENSKSRNSGILLTESVEISQNGMQITYTQCREIPQYNTDIIEPEYSVRRKTYTLEALPQKLYKYYDRATKFVELVKATTPKIIVYTKSMKCMLMENSKNTCFVASFNNGQTYIRKGEDIDMYDVESEIFVPVSKDKSYITQFNQETSALICKASMRYKTMKKLNKQVSSNKVITFPLTLGRQVF
ncbi:hypothetical protein LOTGIDRAFT_157304 [Lottia gigantea]|uniref:Uncharacterized protein n=1 Tax=Lottia gigantea TaxID=225164 RepID=V4B406_LOTGI|nr:hypothetical protein LOTGIDRAFT_157304 [Lottia gigantea]ESP02151.1 hypothetical protein LOTGIDRAFT_157304 [Lottia gigantea]